MITLLQGVVHVLIYFCMHTHPLAILHKVETHLSVGCVHVTQHGKQGTAPWRIIPEELCEVKVIENYAA